MFEFNHTYVYDIDGNKANELKDSIVEWAEKQVKDGVGVINNVEWKDLSHDYYLTFTAEGNFKNWFNNSLRIAGDTKADKLNHECDLIWVDNGSFRTLDGIIIKSGEVFMDKSKTVYSSEGVIMITFPKYEDSQAVKVEIVRNGKGFDVLEHDVKILSEIGLMLNHGSEYTPKVFNMKNKDFYRDLKWYENITAYQVKRVLEYGEFWRLCLAFDNNGNVVNKWNDKLENDIHDFLLQVTNDEAIALKQGTVFGLALVSMGALKKSYQQALETHEKYLTLTQMQSNFS